jgi:hypothetical protein
MKDDEGSQIALYILLVLLLVTINLAMALETLK